MKDVIKNSKMNDIPDINFSSKPLMDSTKIMEILPHRPPFLFVDNCEIIRPGEYGKSEKLFSDDEYFFKGHFPGRPTLPGVLMCESIAQLDRSHALYM